MNPVTCFVIDLFNLDFSYIDRLQPISILSNIINKNDWDCWEIGWAVAQYVATKKCCKKNWTFVIWL